MGLPGSDRAGCCSSLHWYCQLCAVLACHMVLCTFRYCPIRMFAKSNASSRVPGTNCTEIAGYGGSDLCYGAARCYGIMQHPVLIKALAPCHIHLPDSLCMRRSYERSAALSAYTYGPMHCPLLALRIVLCTSRYWTSGWSYALSGTRWPVLATPYSAALSPYAPPMRTLLSAYARVSRCPVLAYATLLSTPGACCTVSGTDIGYGATRCPALIVM
eukprot:3940745-Rhodomonas_salina.24